MLLRPLRESFDKSVMPIFKGKTKIILSELKESDAAILGASALGWEAKYHYVKPTDRSLPVETSEDNA